MVYLSHHQTSKRSQCLCGIYDPSRSHAKYYDVDGSPTAIEGVKQAGEDSPLAGMTEYAFTDRHLVWLQQYWTSEADFHTLTMNYVLTGDKQGMVNDLNAFFNPMKADVD